MKPPERFYFLDNLRAVVIILVIVLHAAITYMAFAPEWWYVLDPERSLFFTVLVLLVDVPIMLVMFFAAGYFALPSLLKRGAPAFLRDKFKRIALPWIFGVLLLAPPTAYMIYFSRGAPVSLLEFWRGDYWGVAYQQSVYWFLGILMLLFGLLALAYTLNPRLHNLVPTVTVPSGGLFVGFLALMTVGFLAMNLIFPLEAWSHIYLFMYQPVRLPLYFGYFILGLLAYRHSWFSHAGYKPRLALWLVLFVASGLLYLGYRLSLPLELQTTLWLKAGTAILFNSFCFSALMFGVALFRRFVNSDSAFWRSQSANSYGIYYLHPLFLYPLAFLFVRVPISIYLKFVIITGLTWLLSWGVSALILQPLHILSESTASQPRPVRA